MLISITDGGYLIHEGDDNVNINAETVGGKNTFHLMATVIFQEQSTDSPATRKISIKHGKSKSLPLCEQSKYHMSKYHMSKYHMSKYHMSKYHMSKYHMSKYHMQYVAFEKPKIQFEERMFLRS